MTLLRINRLSARINGFEVLREVSLCIQAGQTLGVIGESGSGKSMTALGVMRLLPDGIQATGEILLEDRDLMRLSETQMCAVRGSDIGMVFQEPMTALNPLQTIGAQVAETVRIHSRMSRSEAWRRALDALRRVELNVPPGRYPHELSGGQRQRVGIAMAIVQRPKLLIADEPTTALDVTTQADVLSLLRRLVVEDGMALMLISHDLGVVADMADNIAIMRQGAVLETGPLESLTHPYAKALINASGYVPQTRGQILGAPLLQLRDVVREYPTPRKRLFGHRGALRAVDGVSFDINEGENVGLVGESGCGKSTLTRAILGLETLQGGQIRMMGTVISAGDRVPRALRRQMQAVFQDPFGSFNPRHTVRRLVAEPFHLLDVPPKGTARDIAVTEALESVGLSAGDAAKYIHEFSGGQRQRIAIARALIIRPKLIVLDEAVSALDVQVRAQILDLLADLSGRFGLTYLFISHDLSVVRNVTDRVLVMRAGRIVEEGPTATVFESPRHEYTRRLIASTPALPFHSAQMG
jgi:peptide/nickel transport system ATP-binding protein